MTHYGRHGEASASADGPDLPATMTPRAFASAPAEEHFARRTALKHVAFCLPYLQSGVRLLDCGCASGTISVGVGEIFAPGEFVGIDTSDRLLELTRGHARKRGLAYARFEHADIHSLPFAFVNPEWPLSPPRCRMSPSTLGTHSRRMSRRDGTAGDSFGGSTIQTLAPIASPLNASTST